MSISYPIFPGLAPGQSFNPPSLLIRSPKWNWKESIQFNNERQQSVNGRIHVTKYWSNPLHHFEWTYGYIKNNPNDPNPFYTLPVPATDFEILKGFFCGMQAGGNVFAYQPPDSVRGGSFTGTGVQVNVSGVAIVSTNGATLVTRLRLGDILHGSGFSSTYLNVSGTVVGINPAANTVSLLLTTSGTHAFTADSGTLVGGQPLLPPDANKNVQLVQTLGSYPTTPSPTPTMTLCTESLQLIDTSTLVVYAGGTATSSFTLNQPQTVAGYPGYVLTFSGTPASPLTASYTYYYPCLFDEDTQEYENWLTMLELCSSVKFGQYRF